MSFGLLLPSVSQSQSGGGPAQRFVLAAGANDGGEGRVRLRYAGTDATSITRLLEELGGVNPDNHILLLDPTRATLQESLRTLSGRVESARELGSRVEVFFYYSGHSDEEGLLLRDERFGYQELRWFFEGLPSDVKVAILDSCASGAFTRSKGGYKRPAFLVDASTAVKGHAFLTSSSADEAAQESDRLGGSFFTHHLIAGLRGAADSRGSGTVTLTDAYQYAFKETLAQTERTQGGAQHPAYEMQLVGTGDLVITDLRNTSASLVLDETISGRVFVRNQVGELVVEVRKKQDTTMELGIAPGPYVITVMEADSLYEGDIILAEDRKTILNRSQLATTIAESTTLRGSHSTRLDQRGPAGEGDYRIVPFEFVIFPSVPDSYGGKTLKNFSGHLLGSSGDTLDGAQIGLGVGVIHEDVEGAQIALGANHAGGYVDGVQMALGANVAGSYVNGAQLAVGVNVAGGLFDGSQTADTEDSLHQTQMAVGLNLAQASFEGTQMAVGANIAMGSVNGAQMAVGASITKGSFQGSQLAVGLGFTGEDFDGFQASVGSSMVTGQMEGFQTSVGFNYAKGIDGAQLSIINAAGTVNGAQIGLINLGKKVDGAQIGILNLASESEASIGLLSLVGNGRFSLGLWGSDLGTTHLGLKTGSKTVYSILSAGIEPDFGSKDPIWTTGAGVGVHFNLERPFLSFLDTDLTISNLWHGRSQFQRDSSGTLISSLRLGGGWRLAKRFAIVAGPSLNVGVQWGKHQEELGVIPGAEISANDSRSTVRIWPGFFAGIEI